MFDTRRMMCNPFFVIIGFIIGLIIVVKIYYHVIIETFIIGGITIASVLFLTFLTWGLLSMRSWSHAKAVIAMAEAIPDEEPTTVTDEQKITAEADWLASGVELAFTPDGKTLIAKDAKP